VIRRAAVCIRSRQRLSSVALFATLAFVLVVLLPACATSVTPPPAPHDPVTVFIADYGRHASLVIPADVAVDGAADVDPSIEFTLRRTGNDAGEADGGWMWEYSYGDWLFYARDEDSLVYGAFALLTPTRGAVGRRRVPLVHDAPGLRAAFDAQLEYVHAVEVERERARELLERLHERFSAGQRYAERLGLEPIRSEVVGLRFAPDPATYSLVNHCNHELAAWLETLGVETSGNSLVSRYVVEPPPPAADSASDRP